jgi:hypothetical protein
MSDNKPTDNHRKTLKEGSPEERVKAWLQLTLNESGHSKQGVGFSLMQNITVTDNESRIG